MKRNVTKRKSFKRLLAAALCLAQLTPVFAVAETTDVPEQEPQTRYDTMAYQSAKLFPLTADDPATNPYDTAQDQILVTKHNLYTRGGISGDSTESIEPIALNATEALDTVMDRLNPGTGDVAFEKRAYFETEEHAKDGIIKVEIDMKGNVGLPPPVDVVFVLDRSGSMNLYHTDDYTWDGQKFVIDTTKDAIVNGSAHPCLNPEHYYKLPFVNSVDGQTYEVEIYPAALAGLDNNGLRNKLGTDDTAEDYFEAFAAEYLNRTGPDAAELTEAEMNGITLAFTTGQTSNASWWPKAQKFAKYLCAVKYSIDPTNLTIQTTYTAKNANDIPLTDTDENGNETNKIITVEKEKDVYAYFAREHYRTDANGDEVRISIYGTGDTVLNQYLSTQTLMPGKDGYPKDGRYFSPALVDDVNGCLDRAMAARQALDSFMEDVFDVNPLNRVGYVAYHGNVIAGNYTVVADGNPALVEEATDTNNLKRMETDRGGDSGTSYEQGLEYAQKMLENTQGQTEPTDRKTYVIMISDGVPSPANQNYTQYSNAIKERGIGTDNTVIYSIGFQAGNSEDLKAVSSDPDDTYFKNCTTVQQFNNFLATIKGAVLGTEGLTMTDVVGKIGEEYAYEVCDADGNLYGNGVTVEYVSNLIEESKSGTFTTKNAEGLAQAGLTITENSVKWFGNPGKDGVRVSFYIKLKDEYLSNSDGETMTASYPTNDSTVAEDGISVSRIEYAKKGHDNTSTQMKAALPVPAQIDVARSFVSLQKNSSEERETKLRYEDEIEYTFFVKNEGLLTVENLLIEDALPDSGVAAGTDGESKSVTIPELAPVTDFEQVMIKDSDNPDAAPQPFTFTVKVDSDPVTKNEILNQATLSVFEVQKKEDGTEEQVKLATGKSNNVYNTPYTATGTALVEIDKMIELREFWENDTFTFTLEALPVVLPNANPDDAQQPLSPMPVDKDGNEVKEVTIEPTSGSTADVAFGLLNFTEADGGKVYRYLARETQGTDRRMIYDENPRLIEIAVTDDMQGNMSGTPSYFIVTDDGTGETYTPDPNGAFVNEYIPPVDITINKQWIFVESRKYTPPVQIRLTRDKLTGEPDEGYFVDVELNEGNNWSAFIPDQDGNYVYHVQELTNVLGYAPAVVQNGTVFTVQNVWIPQTGDRSSMLFWAAMAGASMAGIALLLRRRRRAKN